MHKISDLVANFLCKFEAIFKKASTRTSGGLVGKPEVENLDL
jgi:hypothetical protein